MNPPGFFLAQADFRRNSNSVSFRIDNNGGYRASADFNRVLLKDRLAARLIDPTVQLLRPVPITAWLPFAIAVFGIYDASALFLIGLGAFYPIVVNTTHGVRDTNLLLLRAARMLGAGMTTILAKVIFPSALPSIFTGLRLGLGLALVSLVAVEFIAAKSGLGHLVYRHWQMLSTPEMYAAFVLVGALGLALTRGLRALQARILTWQDDPGRL